MHERFCDENIKVITFCLNFWRIFPLIYFYFNEIYQNLFIILQKIAFHTRLYVNAFLTIFQRVLEFLGNVHKLRDAKNYFWPFRKFLCASINDRTLQFNKSQTPQNLNVIYERSPIKKNDKHSTASSFYFNQHHRTMIRDWV